MELEIAEKTEEITRLALRGRLDTPGVDQIGAKFTAALAHGGHGVVDLSEVTFLASLGIRLLVSTARTLDRRGFKFVLVAPQPLVEQALKHTSVSDLVPVCATTDEALALLAS